MPSSRPRPGAARRAEEILENALELFAERRFAAVTVRDIAFRSGVTVGLIYYYYEDKAQLFRAALAQAIRRLLDGYEQRRRDHADPVAALDAWLGIHVTIAPTVLRLVKVMADYAASGAPDAAVDALIDGLYRRERELLEATLAAGIAAGVFRPVDPAATARVIGVYLDGVFHAAAHRRDGRVAEDIEAFRRFIRQILGVA